MHSAHRRRLLDLPLRGRAVGLRAEVRRFRCDAEACPRRTFTEPLSPAVSGSSARRTARLDLLIRDLGLVLGRRADSALASRLMMPVGRDTLLRAVSCGTASGGPTPSAIGIDEWAWQRRQRCGTLICDLKHRRIVDLLPDREPGTARAWLAVYPGIKVVARDRASGHTGTAAAALPSAVQLAD